MEPRTVQALDQAIRAADLAVVEAFLDEYPDLIATPVGNPSWGKPLSHAANLGYALSYPNSEHHKPHEDAITYLRQHGGL